ncbi:hypothetical protein I3I95_11205 [bacterium]|nr:hypothetical protein [bacterium]
MGIMGGGMHAVSRQNVGCLVEYAPSGVATPRVVLWPDGRRFVVERVLGRTKAMSTADGHLGVRYTCLIGGAPRHVYWDGSVWFVEARRT